MLVENRSIHDEPSSNSNVHWSVYTFNPRNINESFCLANESGLISHRRTHCRLSIRTRYLQKDHQHCRVPVCENQPMNMFSWVVFAEITYAAAAARDSKGFATVVTDNRAANNTMNAEITPSLGIRPSRKASIHSGAISMMSPRPIITVATKWSIFSSEK